MCNFVTSVFFWRRSLHESAFASWFVFFIVVSRSGLIYNSCFSSTDFFFIHSVKLFSRVSHIEWESTKKKVETWKKNYVKTHCWACCCCLTWHVTSEDVVRGRPPAPPMKGQSCDDRRMLFVIVLKTSNWRQWLVFRLLGFNFKEF